MYSPRVWGWTGCSAFR